MSSSDTSAPCGHSSFDAYIWKDISCNFNGYGHHIPWNASVFCLYAAFHTVAAQLAFQLIGRTFFRFKRRNTLYFWSLIVVAAGILVYIMALLFRIFILPVKSPAFSVPYTFAQIFILTGFGLVLYSRMHLITQSRWLLRGMLAMVVVVAIIGHTMSFVQLAVISLNKTDLSRRIMHRISWLDVFFTIQDVILSVAYIYLYWRHMQSSMSFASAASRARDQATFKLLIAANTIVVLLDVTQNVLLFTKIYLARYMVFPLICAIKLEVEFFVLNRLVGSAKASSHALQAGNMNMHIAEPSGERIEAHVNTRPVASRFASDESSGSLSDTIEVAVLDEMKHSVPGTLSDQPDYKSMQFITEAV